MPARSVFVAAFNSDLENKKEQELDEYLLWVVRFYQGWELYRNGWVQVRNTISPCPSMACAALRAMLRMA